MCCKVSIRFTHHSSTSLGFISKLMSEIKSIGVAVQKETINNRL
jgi:hypothetical protein